MQILVLGMHRSGSSLVTRMLNMLGVYIGSEESIMLPQEDNAKGFWERQDVADINDYILSLKGSSWDMPSNWLVAGDDDERDRPGQHLAAEIVHRMDAHRPWAIKDPRLSITHDFWLSSMEAPFIVFVYRDPVQVAASLNRRDGMPVEYGLALWELYISCSLRALSTNKHVIVRAESLYQNPLEQLHLLKNQLDSAQVTGLCFPAEKEITTFLGDGVMHSSTRVDEPYLTPSQETLRDLFDNEDMNLTMIDEGLFQPSQECINILSRSNSLIPSSPAPKLMHYSSFSGMVQLIDSMRQQIEVLDVEVARANALRNRVSAYRDRFRALWRSFVDFFYKIIIRPITVVFRKVLVPEKKNKITLFFELLAFALKNPRRASRLISWYRIKALFSSFRRTSTSHLWEMMSTRMEVFDPSRRTSMVEYHINPELDVSLISFPEVTVPKVSIVIPVYDQWVHTKNCLHSITINTEGLDYEVILADDGSTDETEIESSTIKNLRVIRNKENLRFLKNCNQAARSAKGEYIVFLNNDTMVLEGWLNSMLDVIDANENIGLIGPKLLFGDGRIQEAGGIIWRDASGWNYGRGMDTNRPEYNYLRETDYISGACLMIRRADWESLGGFDEQFSPAYYEDTDLAFQIRAMGKKVIYQPKSVVVHFEGVSHGTDLDSGIKAYQLENKKVFRNKWKSVLDRDHSNNGVDVFRARERSCNRKTILVVDHYVPFYDRDAGSRSTYQYLKLFVELGYKVIFLADNFYPQQPYTSDLQQLGIEVLVGYWYAENWKEWLKDSAKYIDCVYLHRPHIAEQYLDLLNSLSDRPRLVYFGHDLHYMRKIREAKVSGSSSVQNEADQWKEREIAIFNKVDLVLYPSENEVNEVRQYCDHVRALPLNIYPQVTNTPREEGREGLLFIGGFGHPPNLDALLWFVDEVFPLVLRSNPSLILNVVGSNAGEEVLGLASNNINVIGAISDDELAVLYQEVRLSIVPLRYGAGIKGKIIEAMVNGVPVVTTSVGAEGIPDMNECLLVRDSVEDFAEAVLSLYDDRALWGQLTKAGVEVVNSNFSKATAVEAISGFFTEA